MATTLEVFPSDALLWLEFGGIYTDSAGLRVIDNLATRGDASATVTCGDGTTAATIPAQASGKRGIVLAGTQYIDCGLIDRFERTDAFTLFTVTSNITSASGDIISTIDAGNVARGAAVAFTAPNTVNIHLINDVGSKYISVNAVIAPKAILSICCTYDGSSTAAGVRAYVNGESKTLTIAQNTLTATIKSGKPFILGARHWGSSKTQFLTGNMYFAAIFPLVATATQVNSLHKRVMRRINLP